MWWQRRPQGRLGAPPMPRNFPLWRRAVAIIAVLSLVFPLVGLSLVVVLILDFLVIQRVPGPALKDGLDVAPRHAGSESVPSPLTSNHVLQLAPESAAESEPECDQRGAKAEDRWIERQLAGSWELSR